MLVHSALGTTTVPSPSMVKVGSGFTPVSFLKYFSPVMVVGTPHPAI
jgi:hypothetical protein